jgi:hypothetical protein
VVLDAIPVVLDAIPVVLDAIPAVLDAIPAVLDASVGRSVMLDVSAQSTQLGAMVLSATMGVLG